MEGSTKEIRVTAKTLAIAVAEAAQQLKTSEEQVDYRVVSQTNGGFFSFLGKKVEIAAWMKGRNARGGEKSYENDETPELSEKEIAELVEDLKGFCVGICNFISEDGPKITAELDAGRLVLDIDDEYLAAQINKNSKLAESFEHLLRKKPRHLKRELPFRIFVDVKGIRRQREDDLVELAKDLSEKVHEKKRPIVLNYKSSYDRKIIHMALDQDQRVYTKSIGSGPNRKLMILPTKKHEDEGLVENG